MDFPTKLGGKRSTVGFLLCDFRRLRSRRHRRQVAGKDIGSAGAGKSLLETQPYSATESNRTRRQSPTVLCDRVRTVFGTSRIRTEPYSTTESEPYSATDGTLTFPATSGKVSWKPGRTRRQLWCQLQTVLGVSSMKNRTVLSNRTRRTLDHTKPTWHD